ncbi:MAG TPA: TolC family protein [Polyangiales bacterium]
MRRKQQGHKAVRGAIAAASLSVLLGVGASARAEVVTLAELETLALKHRPALAREAARARAADADLEKAASAYYPQFALKADSNIGPGRQLIRVGEEGATSYLVSGAPSVSDKSTTADQALKPYPRTGLELSGTANLYDFGRTKAATEAGREAHSAAMASQALTESQLKRAVRESYLNWLLQSERERLSREAMQEAVLRRQRVDALIAEGAKPKGEATPARAEELLARLELTRAERDLEASHLAVEHAVGTALTKGAEPDVALLDPQTALPDGSEQQARNLRALEQRFKASLALAEAQSRLNRPQLGFGLSAGVRTSTQNVYDAREFLPDDADRETRRTSVFPLYGAGLTFTAPLWDGGLTKASAAAARARAEEAKADLAEFIQTRELAQREAEIDIESARARLATSEELIAVCSARLADAEAGYEMGVSSIDLIAQARGLLRRAKTEALLARVDHAAARLRMVRKDAAKTR